MDIYFVFAISTYFLMTYGQDADDNPDETGGDIGVDPDGLMDDETIDAMVDNRWMDGVKEQCGTTRYLNKTIKLLNITEDRAQMGRFPWMVRIGLTIPETRALYFYCAGSLISMQYVLSAAHCGKHGQIARIGENNDYGVNCDLCVCPPKPQDIKIRDHLFADHCRMSNRNDLMVVALETKVTFDDFIRPICYPDAPTSYDQIMDKQLMVPGWGAVYSGFGTVEPDNVDRILRYIELPILEPDQCNSVYDIKMAGNQFCVGYSQKDEKPCTGDSGGPLISYRVVNGKERAYLEGIASYDLMKCEMGVSRPVVFTNVGAYAAEVVKLIKRDIATQMKKTKP